MEKLLTKQYLSKKQKKKTKKIPSTNEVFVELWAGWEQLLVTSNEICAWPVFFFWYFPYKVSQFNNRWIYGGRPRVK